MPPSSPRREGGGANRIVRIRPLRPEDVPRVQEIFADGMRSLSPGVVRTGLLQARGALAAAAVGALAAAWTAAHSPSSSPSGLASLAALWTALSSSLASFAAWRAAIVASLSFLTVYACYLSTMMEAYVRESLEGDMRDPLGHYGGGGHGGGQEGGGGSDSGGSKGGPDHSRFWVAELVDGPPTAAGEGLAGGRRLADKKQQQRAREEEDDSGDDTAEREEADAQRKQARPNLRRRLLALAGALAENERAVQEERVAEARAMLVPGPNASSPVVGCVALQHRRGEEWGELRRMSVAESARGNGIAAALARELERHAQAAGLKGVFCTTSSLQGPARALYGDKLGWAEVAAPGHHPQAESNGVTFHRYEKRF